MWAVTRWKKPCITCVTSCAASAPCRPAQADKAAALLPAITKSSAEQARQNKALRKMNMPAFSLILATVGRTQELNRLFDSLAAQTYPDFEIIIVDQNTDDRLLPHIAHAEQAGLTVRHLKHHPPNLAAARNTGLAAAQGERVAFPDDDCWYDPALLQRVALRFTTRPAPEGVAVRWVEQGEPPFTAPVLSWKRSAAFRDVPVASITIFLQRRLLDVIGGF